MAKKQRSGANLSPGELRFQETPQTAGDASLDRGIPYRYMLCPEGLQHKICEFGTHVSNSLNLHLDMDAPLLLGRSGGETLQSHSFY